MSDFPGLGGAFEDAVASRPPSGGEEGIGQAVEGLDMKPCGGIMSVSVFCMTLWKLWVRSIQGLIKTAPAGIGSSRSRKTVRTERHKPPPAESPAKTILLGVTGLCIASGGGWIKYRSEVDEFREDKKEGADRLRWYPALHMAKDTAVLFCKDMSAIENKGHVELPIVNSKCAPFDLACCYVLNASDHGGKKFRPYRKIWKR